jgi:hypothetical protein
MEPRRHDRNPECSAVLAFIAFTAGCDLPTAQRTFHYLRNKGHLVFTTRGRIWQGAEHVPFESEDDRRMRLAGEMADLRRQVRESLAKVNHMQAVLAQVVEQHNALAKIVHDQKG